MALDPVCNMEVDPGNAKWVSEYRGVKYYFCAEGCKRAFEKEPDMFISGGHTHHMGGGCSCCGGH